MPQLASYSPNFLPGVQMVEEISPTIIRADGIIELSLALF